LNGHLYNPLPRFHSPKKLAFWIKKPYVFYKLWTTWKKKE
jgi:hypothetical protein